ncbi:MAG: aconitate hydratase AcnA [Fimbriimonadia bacterium]|nr:aconitate hydratase AcnA [Fimbriimonadia bacterium]
MNTANTKTTLISGGHTYTYFRIHTLEEQGVAKIDRLPFSIRVLLENVLRLSNRSEGAIILGAEAETVIQALANWQPKPDAREIPYMPARVVLQDFTGVPCVVDLVAMRDAMHERAGDPRKINPVVPADLVIDHSVQVDYFGTEYAYLHNVEREFERNQERYALLRWGQQAFDNFRVVPPGTGIVHQVNLEYLGKIAQVTEQNGETWVFPDTLVGTDSHTTMINALGILGWGVGGIEAEAVMLGQPYYMLIPEVVGFKLTGSLPAGATATDLVLTVTQRLRQKGVVEKFVEFYGPGLAHLSVEDRATIANMAPEYGATMGYFPVDQRTLDYLRFTGRHESLVQLVEAYCKEQGLFRTSETPDPEYSDTLELNLSEVVPSLAGPKRPHDRVALSDMKPAFQSALRAPVKERGFEMGEEAIARHVTLATDGEQTELSHGSVVIAAITSCTNTSNPSVMVAAGLLAKKAVERGLSVKPYVKTSLAPGSRVVSDYLENGGLLPFLEALRFHVVGYGCTTCIGNSGPLPEPIANAVREGDLVAAAVLSGNRNFEARINPLVKANYLASPPLVVAYALAGTVDIDFETEPVGHDPNGQPVFLRELWPTPQEVRETLAHALKPEMFKHRYASVFEGDERWKGLPIPQEEVYAWDSNSTYIQKPPYFDGMPGEPGALTDVRDARVLAIFGDSITTDHISPAGAIGADTPAGRYLMEHGTQPKDFNTYGSRRGNHEVMIRGTFANIRIKNLMLPGVEGGFTIYHPTGERKTIYEACEGYQASGTPLVVLAGKEYGSGSSRDWAAKGTMLLGVKAVIAESYERIHRGNLVGMGVLPLQFMPGENVASLGLTGEETFHIEGVSSLTPRKSLTVTAARPDGSKVTFQAVARVDTPVEVEYYRNGGLLPMVLRKMMTS